MSGGPSSGASHGFVPALGPQRRLQALAAMGWGLPELSRRLGVGWERVSQYRRGQHPQVWAVTAEKIVALYNELEMIPGPSTITRRHAVKHGWVPPLGWVDIDDPDERPQVSPPAVDDQPDENIVRAFLQAERRGDPPLSWGRMTPADREALCAGLAERGYKPGTVARLTRSSQHVVSRIWEKVS